MPAQDPEDQAAARRYEQGLRASVARTGNMWELEWFLSQPKRVRRSFKLIHAGLWEAIEKRDEEEAKAKRLAALRAIPRDISCLHADGARPWNGLGRRKKRCRAFRAIGRAYMVHQRAAPSPDPHPVPLLSVDTLVPSTRPATPDGLREVMYNCMGLISIANGPTNSGLNTPADPMPAPLPVPAPCSPPSYPVSLQPKELCVYGHNIDPDYAFIVATGRHAMSPWQGSLRDAAHDIRWAEDVAPGALGVLADLLFPGGVGKYDSESMLEPVDALLDFCSGWYELSSRN